MHLRPPNFDYNQPLIRKGPNDYIFLRNGQKKKLAVLEVGEPSWGRPSSKTRTIKIDEVTPMPHVLF